MGLVSACPLSQFAKDFGNSDLGNKGAFPYDLLNKNTYKDLKAEYEAIALYNEAIRIATDNGDNGTRSLFEGFVREEEEHADWLEGQLALIEQMGIGNYLTTQV